MNQELLAILTQFGAAGLIGLMWIIERRHAAVRDRQITESHLKLISQDQQIQTLLEVVKDNTRAIVTLEHTQRQLVELAQGLTQVSIRHRSAGAA